MNVTLIRPAGRPAGRASTSPFNPVFGWRLLLLFERYFEGFGRVCKSA